MNRILRRGLTVATAIVGVIALSACTSGGGSPQASGLAAKLPGTGWKAVSAADVPSGGTLTLPVDYTPANWNFSNLDAGTGDDQTYTNLFTPSFVNIKQNGTWEVNKDFAESVSLQSTSPQIVEVKINPKAVWSNGVPMTVDDFASTWKSLNGSDPAYAPISTNVWQDISSVTAGSNNRDVLLTFKNTNADWPSILGNIWPKWLGDTPDHFNKSWVKAPYAADGTTIISGSAFILSKFDTTGQVVTFVPNPRWWGSAPKLDSIVFKAVSKAGLSQAYANKEIDVMSAFGNADNYAVAKKRTDGVIESSLSPVYLHVTLNARASVFTDVRVRQAFAKGLNRQVIAEAGLAPTGSPVTVLNSLMFLPGQDGYIDHATKTIGFDVAGAKKLLEKAGYTSSSGGIYAKGGVPLSVRFVIPSDSPRSANLAQQILAQERAIGITVKIDVVPSADLFAKYITTKTRDFDATTFLWQGTPFPISSNESIFYPADSAQNFPGVTNTSLGTDFSAANAQLDPAKRLELAEAIDQKLVDLVSTVPLYAQTYVWGVKKKLVNYGPSQFQTVLWQNVGFVK